MGVEREGGRGAYLFKLQLGPLANVGVGIESCDYATSNCSGIHLERHDASLSMQQKCGMVVPRGGMGRVVLIAGGAEMLSSKLCVPSMCVGVG